MGISKTLAITFLVLRVLRFSYWFYVDRQRTAIGRLALFFSLCAITTIAWIPTSRVANTVGISAAALALLLNHYVRSKPASAQ
jgi:hypothetical protein